MYENYKSYPDFPITERAHAKQEIIIYNIKETIWKKKHCDW